MNNKITVLNIFLGIIGILLFASLIILPPVFRFFVPKGNENVSTTENDLDRVIKCVKSNNFDGGIVDTQFQLYVNNDVMNLVAVTKTTSYNEKIEIPTDKFEEIKNSFNNGGNLFYSYVVEENKISESYRVTIDIDDDLTTTIEDIGIDSSYNNLNKSLLDNGYICE